MTSEVLKTTHNHCLKELHGNMDGLSLHYYVHPEGWEIKEVLQILMIRYGIRV